MILSKTAKSMDMFGSRLFVLILFMSLSTFSFSQRKVKIKLVVSENAQYLKLKVKIKKGDLFHIPESFALALQRDSILQTDEILLPEHYSSILFLSNDTCAYIYEYSKKTSKLDSLEYEKLYGLTNTKMYYHTFMYGYSNTKHKFKIPLSIAPRILKTNPKTASFYLKVLIDRSIISRSMVLFDDCKIIYR